LYAASATARSLKGAVGLIAGSSLDRAGDRPGAAHGWRGEQIPARPVGEHRDGDLLPDQLIGQFNDLAVALAAYNHGPGRIAELSEAKAELPMGYSEKVLSYYAP